MALVINTNVAALNAQRALQRNQSSLTTSFERLSTGLRINSAADDAAGLAITERFTSQIRGLNQAVRNANDGISLAQTTEAALNQMLGALQRMRELAVQSANDTNAAGDRLAIQAEVDQLVQEIDRIATQTNFNDRTVLDGSFTNRIFQIGANENETIEVTIRSARSFNLGAEALVTIDDVTTNTLVGPPTAAAGTEDLVINGIAVPGSSSNNDSVSFNLAAGSAIAKAAAINQVAPDTGVSATVLANDNVVAQAVGANTITAGDILINGVDIGGVAVSANDSDSALRNAINAVSDQTGVQATLDANNKLQLTAADGRNITFTGNDLTGGGVFAAAIDNAGAGTIAGDIRLSGDNDFTVSSSSGNLATNLNLATGTTVVNTAVNIETLSLATQAGATNAIPLLDVAIRQVSSQQADLGALLARFESTVENLSAISENLSAARSRIQDADFAAETAIFSRNQILQQSATAILAQANVAPQIALQLIQ
jgi:flagellin